MAIIERDKSIQVLKDKFILCYDPLNIWFSVYTSRKSTSPKSKTGIIEQYEDMGYFSSVMLACKYTLEMEKDNKLLTNKMQAEIVNIQNELLNESNKTEELINNARKQNDKYKDAKTKYAEKKAKSTEVVINDDLTITFNKEYLYMSYRVKTNGDNVNTKQEYRWIDMGYFPFVWQSYYGLRKVLMLKAINEHKLKDLKAFIKLVNKTEVQIQRLIKQADEKIRKELKIK